MWGIKYKLGLIRTINFIGYVINYKTDNQVQFVFVEF